MANTVDFNSKNNIDVKYLVESRGPNDVVSSASVSLNIFLLLTSKRNYGYFLGSGAIPCRTTNKPISEYMVTLNSQGEDQMMYHLNEILTFNSKWLQP